MAGSLTASRLLASYTRSPLHNASESPPQTVNTNVIEYLPDFGAVGDERNQAHRPAVQQTQLWKGRVGSVCAVAGRAGAAWARVVTAAVRKDAAFEVLAKRLAHECFGLW